MLLRNFASYLRNSDEREDFHIVSASDLSAEDEAPSQAQPVDASELSEIIESDGKMRAYEIYHSTASGFTHFLDGIERIHLIGYKGTAPLLYAFIAAVVRERNQEKRMVTWQSETREGIYVPYGVFDASKTPLDIGIISVRDNTRPEENFEVDPNPFIMLQKCRAQINHDREQLEQILIRKWDEKYSAISNKTLLVDGSLTFEAERRQNIVGLIKSHQTTYFRSEDQMRIMNLKQGERSSVFKVKRRGGNPPLTWYLRLRPNEGRNVFFGLVRIEIADYPGALEAVDEISSWVLAERQPLSLPDGRWDRLLYPIRDCEQYLRAIAPSRIAIQSAMAGV